MIMELLSTVLSVANAVSTVSENLGNNNNRPVEIVEKEVVRENPFPQQAPINLTINVNVFKDGKKMSGSISSNQIEKNDDLLSISQNDDTIDLDLN